MAHRKYMPEKQHNPTTPSDADLAKIEKKIQQKIRVQPQVWQVLWTDCGMPQPASVFKATLQKMVERKQVDFKFIAGSKYYFKS